MPLLRPPSHDLLTLALVVTLFGAACDDPVISTDAQPDAAGPDGAVDAGPDVASLRDAGDIPMFDAGLPPCETPGYFSPWAARFEYFNMSSDGDLTTGLNMDGETTCAPAGNCSDGVDNQIGGLFVQQCGFADLEPWGFNYLIDQLLIASDPPANWIFEAHGLIPVGNDSAAPFELVLHEGQWFPSPDCDEATDALNHSLRCDYISNGDMFHWGSCEPLSSLWPAEIIGGRLVAGGPTSSLSMVYTVQGLTAGMTVHQARVEANVTIAGDELILENGILGGVICPEELLMVLGAILGVDPDDCNMANKIPAPDLEIGCSDDSPDGISVGFVFEAYPAHLVGLLRN